jgi:two-component system sensor histidine kinase YesM
MFQSFVYRNLIHSSEYNLQLVSDNISNDMNELVYFVRWCCSNPLLGSYITSENNNNKSVSLESYSRLKEEYLNCKVNEYIERILICKNDGEFLQLVSSVYTSNMNAAEVVINSDFFEPLLNNDGFYWLGVKNNPFAHYSYNEAQIIPIVRPIYGNNGKDIAGWVYLGISTDIITNYLKGYNLPTDSSLYLTIDNNSYKITSDSISPINNSYTIKQQVNGVANSADTIVSVINTPDTSNITVITCPFSLKGWYLSQNHSKSEFIQQKQFYYLFICLILILLLGLGVALISYLNRTINTPISKIRKKLDSIAIGDFTYDPSIEWDHELGEIGKGINSLSEDISLLMDKRIEHEKQQKDLEYQILLSQVNPHFLYNTLNSIKWMATIQNAKGIAEMTTALARLMKNISKGTTQLITIDEELSLLKDYFVIQQYRYGGAVTIEYDVDDVVKNCMILRFTLQPLVENALFHGIEAKNGTGNISITITTKDSKQIDIIILDNGIGMTTEQIEDNLSDKPENTDSDFFKKIGINNVNRRLQYEFGEKYGITITSTPGEFTKMHIALPFVVT